MFRLSNTLLLAMLGLVLPPAALSQPPQPPATWVDKDTGHRVFRLSGEPGSSGFYFNVNAFTPDGKEMVYSAPDGIHVLTLASHKTRLLVPNPPPSGPEVTGGGGGPRNGIHAIIVGHKTPTVFYTRFDPASNSSEVWSADINTGQTRKLVTLPPRASIATVNADETLAAGTYIEGDTGQDYGAARKTPRGMAAGPLVQPLNKGQMMEERLAARLPLVLFTINLQTGAQNGKRTTLLHSTDWVNHLLFSPSDPSLLMYCHEGPWQKVDRIWMIHTDGTGNTLIHHRTMAMEIAGHEFWGLDGETIWYDWQYPKGEDFFLAGYNLQTQKRTAYHLQRNAWSIHFNLTRDLDLFTGDGGDTGQVAHAPDGQWIELFHPEMLKVTGINTPDLWQPGVFHPEHLVNMSHHNYRLEPNVRFSPDKSLVLFTSNMFGKSYVFGVETRKAENPSPSDLQSTPALAAKFNPANPPPPQTSPARQGSRRKRPGRGALQPCGDKTGGILV